MKLTGYRKWSVAVIGIAAAFAAALLGKLTTELATLIGTIVTGYYAVNGYTTGRGNEPSQ